MSCGRIVPVGDLDARHAPSYPAQCAGDALGERASAAERRGKAKAFGHTCTHCVQCGVTESTI